MRETTRVNTTLRKGLRAPPEQSRLLLSLLTVSRDRGARAAPERLATPSPSGFQTRGDARDHSRKYYS
ncbi:hypothetical protein NDU88_000213 [Pleurodeles waltl]|uniref:Uncharacterized protein n=1 Tax=Pleurodeles waltl TaxID=8319 RepID=A0AAV7N8U6_PLEWA|nr:hypothetical protein NDU88_000213 [Pleurodeles waltl]